MWHPETSVRPGGACAAIEGRAGVKSERRGALCGICGSRKGAVVRCGQGHCGSAFHPLCARNAGLYLAVRPWICQEWVQV